MTTNCGTHPSRACGRRLTRRPFTGLRKAYEERFSRSPFDHLIILGDASARHQVLAAADRAIAQADVGHGQLIGQPDQADLGMAAAVIAPNLGALVTASSLAPTVAGRTMEPSLL